MFNKKYLLILLLISMIFLSINAIAATELSNDTLNFNNNINNEIHDSLNDIDKVKDASNELNNSYFKNNNPEILSDNNEGYVIYVGQNKTENGNGSYDNPFATLKLACDNVSGKEKVTLKIFNGTYTFKYNLKFDTPNLNIEGINGKVIIKNFYNEYYFNESFASTYDNVNYTISNIIFDAKDHTVHNYDFIGWFLPFHGKANSGIYNNCSFVNYNNFNVITGAGYDSYFINCYFDVDCIPKGLFYIDDGAFDANSIHRFEYCNFNFTGIYLTYINLPCDVLMDSVWFGQNDIPQYIASGFVINPDGTYNKEYSIPISRYAIFSVCENYLGDNKYEIVGRLTWNGTNDSDGMENFNPMTVKLTSTTGSICENVTLVNGTFRTIYTSNSTEHKINALLNFELIELAFNTTNIMLNPVSIYYGDEEKICGNFSQIVNGSVSIVVYNDKFNKTYSVDVNNSSSFVYIIPDVLKEGVYTVNVTLNGVNVHGFNATTLTVSRISDYTFNVIVPSVVKVGQNATLSIELPADVNGTVTIKFGNDTVVLPANQTMTIGFSNLNATNYLINISYSGSDKYTYSEKIDSISVDPAESYVNAEDMKFIYSQSIIIPVTAINATGVNARVLKDGVEVVNINGSLSEILIPTLDAGKYIVEMTTIVNGNYQQSSKSINLTIDKANAMLQVESEFISLANDYYAGERGAIFYAILKDIDGNPIANKNVQIIINNMIYNVTTDKNGKAGLRINLANANKYLCIVTFQEDNNYNTATMKYSKVILNKKMTILKATNQVFKIKTKNKKVTVNLKTVKNPYNGKTYLKAGKKITLKIKGKTYTAKTNKKGIATFKINLSKKGKYTAKINFNGDKTYKKSNRTIKITIK